LTTQFLDLAVSALRERFGDAPSTAIVLGSGLGGLVKAASETQTAPYGELGLPVPNVSGHAGTLVVGKLGSASVALLSGRIHVYEGRSMEEVVRNVRAMSLWGVKRVVLTNAAGAIDPKLGVGDLMALSDHLNFMGCNPLRGPNLDTLGPRFPDMTTAYDPTLRAQAIAAGKRVGVQLREGVYAATPGPSYETPAEVRMFGLLGANTVGMSTVPECIALNHMGTPVLAICMASNLAAGLSGHALNHAEVKEAAQKAGGNLAKLLQELLEEWE
jgi:purine-nucleoside phosphorylase